MKNYILALFILISISVVTGCSVDEIDYEQPRISIKYPSDNMIIGDTLNISIDAFDDDEIVKVEYYIDRVLDEDNIDLQEPYNYFLVLTDDSSHVSKELGSDAFDIGSHHTIFARALDNTDLEMISNFVEFDYEYRSLIRDSDEYFGLDIDQLMVRSTDDRLDFRVSTNGTWRRTTDSTGLNIGIFLDTDMDASTGFLSDTLDLTYTNRIFNADSIHYPINDIGAEYALFSSFEGERGIYKWNSNSTQWDFVESLRGIKFEKDTTEAEFSINLSSINNPSEVNIVIGSMYYTNKKDNYFWDLAPDQGHEQYIIENNYMGKSTF